MKNELMVSEIREGLLDLNHDLTEHPESTFYAWMEGDAMLGYGISDGDLLVIDRSVVPENGDFVICVYNGELLVRKMDRTGDETVLRAASSDIPPVAVTPGSLFQIWGTVACIIRNMRAASSAGDSVGGH